MRRDKYIQIVVASLLTILIAVLLPTSGGNIITALLALHVGTRPSMDDVTAHQVKRDGGYIDRITRSGSSIIIEGWALNVAAKRPATRVQIFVNGTNAGSVAPQFERLDVAKAFGVTSSRPLGFRAIVSGGPSVTLRIFTEDPDGTFAEVAIPQGK